MTGQPLLVVNVSRFQCPTIHTAGVDDAFALCMALKLAEKSHFVWLVTINGSMAAGPK